MRSDCVLPSSLPWIVRVLALMFSQCLFLSLDCGFSGSVCVFPALSAPFPYLFLGLRVLGDGVAFCYPIRYVSPSSPPMFRSLFSFLGFGVLRVSSRFSTFYALYVRFPAPSPWICGFRAWFVFCPFPFLEVAGFSSNPSRSMPVRVPIFL